MGEREVAFSQEMLDGLLEVVDNSEARQAGRGVSAASADGAQPCLGVGAQMLDAAACESRDIRGARRVGSVGAERGRPSG